MSIQTVNAPKASSGNLLPIAERAEVRHAFVRLLLSEKRRVALAIGLHLIAAVASAVAPLLLGEIIDALGAGGSVADVDRLALGIGAAALAVLVFTWAGTFVAHRLGERLSATMRERFVDQCLRLPMPVVERAGSGDLMTRSSGDVPEAGGLFRDGVPQVTVSVLKVVVYLSAMVWVSPLLALCMLVAVPTITIGTRWYLKRARAGYLNERKAESTIGDTMAASADGARTTATYRLRPVRDRAGDDTVAGHWSAARYTLFLRSVFFPFLDGTYALPTAAVLLIGGAFYFDGAVSLGMVASCAVLTRQIMFPLDHILMWIEKVQRGFAALARVEGVSGIQDVDEGATDRRPEDGAVALHGVRYAYPGGGDVLHGVDLEVPAGQRLAVVGPSGAGKSTLARLISGADVPRDGAVTIGGVDVAALPLSERRSRVTLVTQEHHVFTATLRDNLVLAKSEADDAELERALAAVGADWAFDLPDGLDTELGGTARELDAASAQQIALARIILADPDVVILDEATAMLDPRAARDTERALGAVLEGRTVIAIAHRLHTAHDADRIAVVEEGLVAELGSHDGLIALDGHYAGLWRAWHGEFASAEA
ncbi:ABC transporter ATP-binding protein [Glycomyces buryatensis]|uniref:ABC transporter ATP-binding protein n=1 Tax=Glycomyces buryatensis TaxID=2570927 RepID=A0A4S8Q5W8_9ACTN|nr:ABC transporter ATP-binding protein [Glycomyces buryatensis]THV38641.1 ABC transporter ATP-binding protein [Glycomyces buryatensis]